MNYLNDPDEAAHVFVLEPTEADEELVSILTRIALGLERLFVATAALAGLAAVLAVCGLMLAFG